MSPYCLKKKSEPDELSRTISFPLKSQRCEICEGNGKLFLETKIKLLIYSNLHFFFSYFLVFRVRLPTSLIFSRREINVGWKSLARYQSDSLGSKVANVEVVQISLCICTKALPDIMSCPDCPETWRLCPNLYHTEIIQAFSALNKEGIVVWHILWWSK